MKKIRHKIKEFLTCLPAGRFLISNFKLTSSYLTPSKKTGVRIANYKYRLPERGSLITKLPIPPTGDRRIQFPIRFLLIPFNFLFIPADPSRLY